jgi:hypothetical protein
MHGGEVWRISLFFSFSISLTDSCSLPGHGLMAKVLVVQGRMSR